MGQGFARPNGLSIIAAEVLMAMFAGPASGCMSSLLPSVCGQGAVLIKNSRTTLVNVPPRVQPIYVSIVVATTGDPCPAPINTVVTLNGPCLFGSDLSRLGRPGDVCYTPRTTNGVVPINWPAHPFNRRCNISCAYAKKR